MDRPDPDQPVAGSGWLKDANPFTGRATESSEDVAVSPDEDVAAENGSSYFSSPPTVRIPESPGEVARGARTGAELLRRLSLVDFIKPEMSDIDLPGMYPHLDLIGNIISASICLPYQISHNAGKEWELDSRRGTSAMFDNYAYLGSSQSKWKHTLVGWTGEIRPVQNERTNSILISHDRPVPTSSGLLAPERPTLSTHRAASSFVGSSGISPHLFNPATDTLVINKEDRTSLEKVLENDKNGRTIPVWLSDDANLDGDIHLKDQSKWRRYAEHELYTLFHYRQHAPDDGRREKKSWANYERMNQAFADRILQIYQPGDIVWIHDYHLMLLPALLRQRVPDIYIGFFLHIPFPSSEFMRCLPRRKEILTGILGATMVGFQAFSFARHFNSCCKRILGFESNSAGVDAYGAHVAVDVFPIGLDVAAVQKAAFEDPDIETSLTALRKLYAGKKIVVGRDRLDTVRGVSQKFMAFEIFLDRYPEWRDKVVLIQVTSPTSVEEEKEDSGHKIEHKISSLVSRINGQFGSLSYSPVQHYPQYLSGPEYFSLLRAADVGLITSVRDGMNTTGLEYVICQKGHHGPLILSEFSGTAACLSTAININPWDLSGVADALSMALSMSNEEKKQNHDKLYNYVITHTVENWSFGFLKRLLTNLTSSRQNALTPALDRKKMLRQYHKANKRLFMFDYDGTLTPIVKDPNAAIPSDKVLRNLKTLAQDPKNHVWIISGRDTAFLEEWMGHITELGLSAEHGCFMKRPGKDEWDNLAQTMDMGWQKEVMEVFNYFTERTQGSWVEKKRVALTWHYRQADPDFGAFQARECRATLESGVMQTWDVEVMSGKANLEVRPEFVNKGYIASRLVGEFGAEGGTPPEFVLCMGDDQTDEDMFRALLKTDLPREQVFACTVGASSKRTQASWHLLEPSDVIASIAALNRPMSEADL